MSNKTTIRKEVPQWNRLAQQVFIKDKHPSTDGTDIGATDTKRMLDAYLTYELKGESEKIVKYTK